MQLRAKKAPIEDLKILYEECNMLCKKYDATLLLNGSLEIAESFNCTKIHLSAKAVMDRQKELPKSLIVCASCHNEIEIRKAISIGVNFIVLSPVNLTATHPNATPLGWSEFSRLCSISSIPVFALGGMSKSDLTLARKNGAQGIAAIRSFWN